MFLLTPLRRWWCVHWRCPLLPPEGTLTTCAGANIAAVWYTGPAPAAILAPAHVVGVPSGGNKGQRHHCRCVCSGSNVLSITTGVTTVRHYCSQYIIAPIIIQKFQGLCIASNIYIFRTPLRQISIQNDSNIHSFRPQRHNVQIQPQRIYSFHNTNKRPKWNRHSKVKNWHLD
jgi:hypothetical protein